LNELALFAGAGGGILGGHLLGWRTVCAVEWEAYPASVLCARQNDGFLPPFPIWDDVQTFDRKPWRGIVDVVSGGFPCQDISAAGKGAGIDGERSGMWGEMARIIYEVRPRYAFVENSPMLTSRGLGRVLGDLAAMGFDARWGVLGAADIGANHQRDRIWIVARWQGNLSHAQHNSIRWWEQQQKSIKETNGLSNSNSIGLHEQEQFVRVGQKNNNLSNNGGSQCLANSRRELWDEGNSGKLDTQEEIGATSAIHNQSSSKGQNVANTTSIGQQGQRQHEQSISTTQSFDRKANIFKSIGTSNLWKTEPNVGRVANGVAAGVDRLKAIGNGQVPLCAATAWRILSE
jgi:DNA (cytosine-5)-methyltransferase 1